VLGKYNLAGKVVLPFDVHFFALANAFINGLVALLLIAGLIAVKKNNYELHKKIMLTAMVLSVLFLVSYICHHLLAGDTSYGETDGIKGLSDIEKIPINHLALESFFCKVEIGNIFIIENDF
jgi:putative membrane protein